MAGSTINIRVDPEKKNRLDALAEATGRSRSFLIAEAIDRYLADAFRQIATIQEGSADADVWRIYQDGESQAEMRQIIAEVRSFRNDQAPAGLIKVQRGKEH